ncbi:MAG: hypothetical protein ACKVQU_09325 [Burkholderiales bacterium]
MRLNAVAAAISTLVTFSFPLAFGDDQGEAVRLRLPLPCTPQAQQCLEKLSALVGHHDRSSASPTAERGWRNLIEAYPECAIELGTIEF